MRTGWWMVFAGACSAAGNGGATATPGCVTTGHPLRFACSVDVADDTPVTWQVFEGDLLVRTFETVGPDLSLWGLAPERTYTWQAEGGDVVADGAVTTGALGSGVAALQVSTSGVAPAVDAVLLPASCGTFAGLVMLDGDGAVVWYEDLGGEVGGFDWSDRGAVAALDGDTVVEVSPDGTVLRQTTGFDLPLHHDVATDGERIWALNADAHDGYVVDGLYVLDAEGDIEATWSLTDVVVPSGSTDNDRFWASEFPGAGDWSHGNSIELGPDGTGLLSLRWQDAVVQVVVDPGEPDFGAIDWSLTGTSSTAWPSDFAWSDDGGFDGQHHASWTPDGDLSVFDNGSTTSRAVVMSLSDGTVREAAAYPMGDHCNVQGSAYVTEDGTMIATCASSGTTSAFEASASGAYWSLRVSCPSGGGGFNSMMARAMPLIW